MLRTVHSGFFHKGWMWSAICWVLICMFEASPFIRRVLAGIAALLHIHCFTFITNYLLLCAVNLLNSAEIILFSVHRGESREHLIVCLFFNPVPIQIPMDFLTCFTWKYNWTFLVPVLFSPRLFWAHDGTCLLSPGPLQRTVRCLSTYTRWRTWFWDCFLSVLRFRILHLGWLSYSSPSAGLKAKLMLTLHITKQTVAA